MSIDPRICTISIIIPTLNEAANLPACLAALAGAERLEVIVADGGSRDATCELARGAGTRLLRSPPGRARQQNSGAAEARGDILLFLHADTILPSGFAEAVRNCLAHPGVAAGAFRLGIAGAGPGLRLVAWLANCRSRWLQLPYGDQALFMTRETFTTLGGFPAQEIMEDFELVRRLKRRGRVTLLEQVARTSGRRWQRLGVIRTTLVNQLVIGGYLLGLSPARLAGWYWGAAGGDG